MFISFWSLVSVCGLLKAEDGLVACIDDLGLLICFGFLGFLRGERLLLRVFGAAVDFCCSKNEYAAFIVGPSNLRRSIRFADLHVLGAIFFPDLRFVVDARI